MKNAVVYCGSWGYLSRVTSLAAVINDAKQIEPEFNWRTRGIDVVADVEPLFSNHAEGCFLHVDESFAQIP